MNSDSIAALYVESVRKGIEKSKGTIKHCLDQISNDQFWWRPNPEMNSIANILLHLTGNIKQWIIAGIEDLNDQRDRPAEFSDRSGKSVHAVWEDFSRTLDAACLTLSKVDAESLNRTRRIQGYDVKGLDAIYNSASHLQGHTQEIIYITRMMLGPSYKLYYTPPAP